MVRDSHRVLKWLHDSSAPRSPAQIAPIESKQPADAVGAAAPATEAPQAPLTARQRVSQLWRTWKSKALRKPDHQTSLSPAVLKQHQKQCDLQSVSSIGLAAAADAAFDASAALAAAAALPWAARLGLAAAPAASAPQNASCSAVPPSRVDAAYGSAFYQPSANTQPSKGSASPQTPRPAHLVEAGAVSHAPLLHRRTAAINSPLPSGSNCSSTAAHTPTADTPSPSVTPRGVSVLRCDSSFNQTHASRDPSHHSTLALTRSGSRDWDEPVLPVLGGSGDGGGSVHNSGGWPSPPAVQPRQVLQAQRSPLQHSPDVFSGAHNAQLQQLLQAPKQASPMQQLRPASSAGTLLPAGTALTAYPAVAAAISNAAAAGWLQHGAASTGPSQQSSSSMIVAPQPTAGPHSAFNKPLSDAPAFESPFAQAAGRSAVPPAPEQSAASTTASGPASTTAAEVQSWLLRAAVLEDELQGRAMEVGEELQLLQERREVLAPLAEALQQNPAGSAAHAAAVQSAVSSLGAGRDSRGSLYRAGRVAEGARPRTPGIRSQVCTELLHLDSCLTQLQSRASGLGSALAALQGVQAVLGSSRATKMRPCSRLAVLQLVMSDVVARLPEERLQELPVLEGLPALDQEAREICRLAEAGSLQAAVQPLLHAGAYPSPATPSASAVLPASGLYRQDTGYSASIASASTATASYSYGGPSHSYANGSGSAAGIPQLSSMHNQQHQQQQQQPWYEGLKPEGGADSDDKDDDIMDSLSSVLSSRHYTPRPSLSYESRKAAAAAEARRQAAALAQRPASAIAPPGSAAAAGAAALTLAGIAGSGSWSQWGPDDASSCSYGIGGSSHAGLWDMVRVHHLPSQHSGAGPQLLLPAQPSSPSSVASSRRASSRVTGFGVGPSGLPYPLPSWPESPRAAQVVVSGLMRSPDPPHTPQNNLPPAVPAAAMLQHSASIALGHLREAYSSRTWPMAVPTAPQQQLSEQTAGPGVQLATPETADGMQAEASNLSRSSSFDSCVSARSRFSMEVTSRNSTAASSMSAPVSAAPGSNIRGGGQPPAVVQALPLPQPGPAGADTLGLGTGGAAAAARGVGGKNLVDSPIAAALPAGVDLHSMTVGELLHALSSAVSQCAQASTPQHP